jgi:hypothetical protein
MFRWESGGNRTELDNSQRLAYREKRKPGYERDDIKDRFF